jgi:hypothetical protein
MSSELPPQNPEGELTPEERRREELLDQGKGWEALQYALQEGLPLGDDAVFDALDAVKAALERDPMSISLREERMKILRWRFPDRSDEELREVR